VTRRDPLALAPRAVLPVGHGGTGAGALLHPTTLRLTAPMIPFSMMVEKFCWPDLHRVLDLEITMIDGEAAPGTPAALSLAGPLSGLPSPLPGLPSPLPPFFKQPERSEKALPLPEAGEHPELHPQRRLSQLPLPGAAEQLQVELQPQLPQGPQRRLSQLQGECYRHAQALQALGLLLCPDQRQKLHLCTCSARHSGCACRSDPQLLSPGPLHPAHFSAARAACQVDAAAGCQSSRWTPVRVKIQVAVLPVAQAAVLQGQVLPAPVLPLVLAPCQERTT
jgi:hypothetical protein